MAIPFGLSLTDFTNAIRLSKEIYERCTNEGQGANVKYQQFINDIRVLGQSLERLQAVVRRYESQYFPQQWQTEARDARMAETPWPQLTGDFDQTLQECNALLSQHGYLKSGRTNTSANLRWWLSAESRVNNLMAKLRFHITKVDFYTRPSEFNAVIKNGSEIEQLRRQVASLQQLMINGPEQSNSLSAIILSTELETRLETEFQTSRPSWSVEGSEWPMKESLEAFAFHFALGTVRFNPAAQTGSVPQATQYMNLVKAIWILEKVKKNYPSQAAGSESLWFDRMRQCEDDLRGQLHRFESGELEKPSLHKLSELSEHSFAINRGIQRSSDPLDVREPGPLEEKIAEIQLPSESTDRTSTLLVFRGNETDFRLVTSTKQADTGAQHDKDFDLHMDEDRLVPAYGNPMQGVPPRYNLLLFDKRGKKPKEFVFSNTEDLRKLQRALTGYRVHHAMSVARWCINGSEKPSDSGKGMMQLWQFKPLPAMSYTSPQSSGEASPPTERLESQQHEFAQDFFDSSWSISQGPRAQASGTSSFAEMVNAQIPDNIAALSSTLRCNSLGIHQHGRSGSQVTTTVTQSSSSRDLRRLSSAVSGGAATSQSSVVSPVRGPRGDGIELLVPELPVLMLLTLCNGRYSFLHLTLDAIIHVEPRSCGCRNPNRHCNRVILESKKKHFAIRTLTADRDSDGGLENWDLSAFRLPRSEKWKKATVNEKVKTLELQFPGEQEKNEFLKELQLLENMRTVNQNAYESSLRETARQRDATQRRKPRSY